MLAIGAADDADPNGNSRVGKANCGLLFA